jgi:hypothetical protein
VKDVRCPRCAALFTPDQIRAANPTARCSFCKTELLVRQELPPPPPEAPPPPPPPMPPFFEVTETAPRRAEADAGDPYRSAPASPPRSELTIHWRDRRDLVPAILAMIFLWGLVAPFLVVGAWWAPVGVVIGLAGTFVTVATAVNWSRVRVDADAIEWTSHPLPVDRRRRVPIAEVAQLFTVRAAASYVVNVKTRRGKVRVIAAVASPAQASWLEYAIERHLGIEDQPVEGELP